MPQWWFAPDPVEVLIVNGLKTGLRISALIFALATTWSGSVQAGISPTSTTVDPQSTVFSAASQSITLTATVTSAVGAVSSGQVTFQVTDGVNNVGTAVTDTTISAGAAQVSYTLPAATPTGNYRIDASYTDGQFQFQDSTGSNNLSVAPTSDVGFFKSFLPDTIGPGSTAVLRFDIDNSESQEGVTDIAFTDNLPAGMTLADPANAATDCIDGSLNAADGGTVISLSGARLGQDSACSVTVDVVGTATATNVSGDLTSSTGSSGSAAATLTVDTARPGFSKRFDPQSIPLGGTSALEFVIDNSASTVNALSANFVDTLPSGLVIATPPNANSDCNATINADPGTDGISINSANVNAGAVCIISVDVTASVNGTFLNRSGELQSGQFASVSSGFATASLDVPVDFLVKSFVDDPVPPGQTVTLEFEINNPSRTEPATAIAFDDDLEAVLQGLAAVGLPLNDVCGPGSQVSGAGMLSFTGGSLPPEGSCTFSLPLQVPAGTASGTYVNTTSSITADIGGDPTVGNSASDQLVVQPAPRLTKEFIDDPVGGGGSVTLRFTIVNTYPGSDLFDIAFTDDLNTAIPTDPGGVPGLAANSLVVDQAAVPVPDVCGAGSELTVFDPPDIVNPPIVIPADPTMLIFSGGRLAPAGMPGDSCTFDVVLDLRDGLPSGIYTNTSSAITGNIDTCGECTDPVAGLPAVGDLIVVGAPRLLKEYTDDPAVPGGTVNLEFALEHAAAAVGPATAISFTDDLGASLGGLVATGLPQADVCGAGSSIDGTSVLTFSGGTLAPGDSCTISVSLTVPDPVAVGDYPNTTSAVTANVAGVATVGQPASDDLRIAGLSLSKDFTDDPVLPGGTVNLRFTLENLSPASDAVNIAFTDDLNAVISGFAAAPGALPVFDVCGTGSSITGMNNDTVLNFQGGTVPAGAQCSFDVPLSVPAAAENGDQVNVTSNVTAEQPAGSPVIFDPASDPLTVNDEVMTLSKTFTDDPAAPGTPVTLEFSITNLDPVIQIDDISFTDNLDAALPGLVAVDLPASDVCGPGSEVSGSGVVTLTGGTLAGGATCSFRVTLQVPADVSLGTFTNVTSPATGLVGVIPVTGPPATDNLQTTVLDLAITADNGQFRVGGGTVVDYLITAENISSEPELALGAQVDVPIPANFTPMGWICTPAGGALCPDPDTGSGAISERVDLPVASSVSFLLTGTVAEMPGQTVDLAAAVLPPPGLFDIASINDSALDSDLIVVEVILASSFEAGETPPAVKLIAGQADISVTGFDKLGLLPRRVLRVQDESGQLVIVADVRRTDDEVQLRVSHRDELGTWSMENWQVIKEDTPLTIMWEQR